MTKVYVIYDNHDNFRGTIELTDEEYGNFREFLSDSPNLRIEPAA